MTQIFISSIRFLPLSVDSKTESDLKKKKTRKSSFIHSLEARVFLRFSRYWNHRNDLVLPSQSQKMTSELLGLSPDAEGTL